MRRCWELGVLLFALMVVTVSIGHAQASPARTGGKNVESEEDARLAKQYYLLGEELYQRSDYDGALKQFQQAYKYAHRPALLYNIARCYESLNRQKEAIAFYQKYLDTKDTKSVKVVTARIKNLRRLLARREAAEAERKAALDKEHQRRLELEKKAAALAREKQQRQAKENRVFSGLPGWITAGTGLALLATGAIFGVLSTSKAKSLEDANELGEDFSAVRGDIDTGKTFEKVSIGMLVAGGVVTIAGGVLLFLHFRSGGSSEKKSVATTTEILPAITPNGAYLGARVRF